jgi:hypothetical protein
MNQGNAAQYQGNPYSNDKGYILDISKSHQGRGFAHPQGPPSRQSHSIQHQQQISNNPSYQLALQNPQANFPGQAPPSLNHSARESHSIISGIRGNFEPSEHGAVLSPFTFPKNTRLSHTQGRHPGEFQPFIMDEGIESSIQLDEVSAPIYTSDPYLYFQRPQVKQADYMKVHD